MTKQLLLSFAIGFCSLSAVADGTLPKGNDVTAEKAAQNTPSGWTAVSLPNIPAITSSNTFTITDATYGASTSSADNSTAINNAIKAANNAGGGMVVIPAGTWTVANPLYIKSKVVLHLAANATLLMAPYGTYPNGKSNYFIQTDGSSVTDVIIEGEGITSVIDGQGDTGWWENYETVERPGALIRFLKGSSFLVRNLKIQDAPNKNLSLGNSGNARNSTVHDVTIKNPSSISAEATADGYTQVSHNTDGIDAWGSYTNIYDCTIDTGDDNVVFDSDSQYGHVWHCTFKRGHGASLGSYTESVHDIIYEDITFNGTASGFKVKTQRGRSGNDKSGTSSNGSVKNITFKNSTMTGVTEPIVLTTHYDGEVEDPSTCTSATITYQTPEYSNILFQNITSTNMGTAYSGWSRQHPVYIYGLPEIYIHDVTFDNVKIDGNKGTYMAFCKDIHFINDCDIYHESSDVKYEATYDGSLGPESEKLSSSKATTKDNAIVGTCYTLNANANPSGTSGDYIKLRTNKDDNAWVFSVNSGYKIKGISIKAYSNNSSSTASIGLTSITADGTAQTIPSGFSFPTGAANATTVTCKDFAATNNVTVTFNNSNITSVDGSKNAQLCAIVTLTYASTTGINEVVGAVNKVQDSYYNLAGQRVSANAKGIVIHNGRKYIGK